MCVTSTMYSEVHGCALNLYIYCIFETYDPVLGMHIVYKSFLRSIAIFTSCLCSLIACLNNPIKIHIYPMIFCH